MTSTLIKKIFLSTIILVYFSNIYAQILDSMALENTFSFTSIEEAIQNPESVIRLELRKKKIKNFPIEIFLFKNLQYLDISKNNIKSIPDSLDLLPNLQYFNASKNKISEIPNSIGKMKNLKWMIWNNNEIGMLPYAIGNLEDLQYLDLWNNNLSIFPESMSKLKKLKTFDLRHILLNEQEQTHLHDLLPSTIIYMDRPCNCN
ncbi:MAG: leucine-rich repeat domain-containing protein [Bacteroidota bacterium]|jgi:Leucine-rich repeat (LRR) protein